MKNSSKGITLVALVVTIIVLIILAGVSINLVLGENGIITKAKQAKEMMEIASLKEKLELNKTELLLSSDYTFNLQNYINSLIEKEIITSNDIENTEYDNSKLITINGYVFLLTEEDEDIKIEVQGKVGGVIIVDRTKPILTIMSNTVNTISIEATDNSSGIVGYIYSKTNTIPENFIECENTLCLNITIQNLEENTKYYIWVKDLVGNISEYKTATTSIGNYSLNNGGKYNTLAQAVENAAIGDTINVIKDYTDTSDVNINKNLILNTNGKTLIRTKTIQIAEGTTVEITGEGTLTTEEEINLITNNGNLNITHEGTISNTNTGNSRAIYSAGKINKTGSGIISSTGTKATILGRDINISNGKVISINSYGVSTSGIVNISNNAILEGTDNALFLVGTATATISGGSLNASKYDGIYTGGSSKLIISGGTITGKNAAIYHESTNTIEINGGNLIGTNLHGITISKNGSGNIEINDGNISGYVQGIYKTSSANLIINGGTIKATTKYDGISIAEEDTGNLTITGGTIIGNNNAIWSAGKGNITISGGTLRGNTYYAVCIVEKMSGKLTITEGILTGKSCGIRDDSLNTTEKKNILISGGTITGQEHSGIHLKSSNIELNILGGSILGAQYGVLLKDGNEVTLNVLGGNLTGTSLYSGIGIFANGTVNIGDGTKAINNNNLIVTGETYGIYKSTDYTATINYNNGTLKGKTAGYNGTINVRNGYTVNKTTIGEYQVITLK